MKANNVPQIRHRYIEVQGIKIFYRESLPENDGAPVLLLLHGFPSASHQYRNLMNVLGGRYRLIAPDYPGFGHSEMPEPASAGGSFTYSFDALGEVMGGFVRALGLARFALYMFDFGAPVGFRLAMRHTDHVDGLIIQNGNAYLEGLSDDARKFVALTPEDDGALEAVHNLLTLETTRFQYESGVRDPERIAPDGWILDQYFLDLPGRKQVQVDLAFDYKNNLKRYGEWQAWMREHQPATLITWGGADPFFPEPGAWAYRADLPQADIHIFETGHFALEDKLGEIASLIDDFLGKQGQSK